jgi:hypothetical protein
MKRWIVRAVLFAGGVLCFAGPVAAQFYGDYGGWGDGGAALLGADYRQATAMQLKAQNRAAGTQAAQGQNAVVQSGIRNTLSSEAESRNAAILSKQQATQDWWFQQQQQQAARQPSVGYAMAATPATGWSGVGPSIKPPPASMDIFKWPTMLQEACFASARATIEAPYRRTPPTIDQAHYRDMASAVEDMKAILVWRQSEGVNLNEFNAAKDYVTQLGGEIAKQLQTAKAP